MGGKLRVGMIGTGMMGLEHIRNLFLMPDAELVAFSDPHEESRNWAQFTLEHGSRKEWAGSARPFADHREMLAKVALDAVMIVSPNHTHRAVLDDVMAAQKHILCEKPLCTTNEDAMRVATAARTYKPVFWVGMEYRYMPPVTRFIADVHGGRIGALKMLAIREHRFPFLKKVGDWNRFAANTGGTMVEKCCHFFDLMRHIVRAEPVRVYCSGAMDTNHRDERYDGRMPDIIDNAFAVVDFANGVRASLDLCMFAEGSHNQEEIAATGDQAKLEVFIPDGTLVFSPRAPKGVVRETVAVDDAVLAAGTHHGATYYQLKAFVAACLSGAPAGVSADDGMRAVAMGIAAEVSAREKRVVTMTSLGL
ncbi:MAG TPA: Gfo/Idh/MocA family oxidoreductase [Micropepsaceae bacterium]|nr:Gfo/Idh/MocA family oxidoreductase [Micropepsaceae bacterium]